jgi:enamine deaminase RidA (YjgF/YER057c/UK114 family)
MIEFLMVPGAPTPVAPFSHVVTSNGWLFVTGQMPTDPNNDGAALPDGIEAQTRRVYREPEAGAGRCERSGKTAGNGLRIEGRPLRVARRPFE